MQLSKITLTVLLGLAITGCANRMSQDGSLEQAQQDYQQYQDLTSQYQINEQWWQGYNDRELNRLVEMALRNNVDLAKAAISVNQALYNANLVGADLVPGFSGSGSAGLSKGVGDPSHNAVSTGTSTRTNSLGLNVSYTIDLWKRLADTASAAEWTHKASQEDLAAARLALINSTINAYYNLAYLKEAIAVTQQSIRYYEQIQGILNNKLKAGAIDGLSVEQANQAVLTAKNTLISLRSSQKTTEQTLRNLLNLGPNDPLAINSASLSKVKVQGVNLNVPVSTIANRPDVKASLARLQSSFNSLSAMEKSWFPTVTIGANLTGSGSSVQAVGQNTVLGGTLGISLPFLDWNRVKWNVKISEASYETAKLNYQQSVTTALNEIDTYYYTYGQYRSNLANLQKTLEHNRKISQYYKNRYDQGVSEFREWINAVNTEKNSQLSVLQAKYSLIQAENAVYQAMAGKYRP
ncbi:hypothetical protein A4G20_08470 [Pasteurellaceae bacterium RH1A]|nr:hypothetical protein A4G20_08470 [Pasteurellaceae bacterium RH1A]